MFSNLQFALLIISMNSAVMQLLSQVIQIGSLMEHLYSWLNQCHCLSSGVKRN